MGSYSFVTLNDKEFEELVRDLLQKHFNIFLESFKKGQDKGIDLRCASINENLSIIVQAKQFEKSGYSALYQDLKKEVSKVKSNNPSRYIVATSVALSPANKDSILKRFEGYIIQTSDIFGKDDLNNLLELYPEVLRAHAKLYLSSITVLNEIVNNHIKSRSDFKIKEIQKSIHLYVTNSKYEEAIDILNKEHFLIVTGDPGIGKTALANFISYQHLVEGFRFIYIFSDLTDAEKVVDNEDKQLFYFDDFLGANYLKIKYAPNQDAQLLNFIQRVKLNKNKRMILTTRTTILNQARGDFEKLNSHELDIASHEINIDDYQPKDKALILYNHLYHSDVPRDYIENFISEKVYHKIISHANYNPRIIEYISDHLRLKNISAEKYSDFIIKKLDRPEDIWKDPYEMHLDESEKFLLQTMFTLPFGTNEVFVKDAFNERISYEIHNNGFQRKSNLFNLTVKKLLGGFINRKINKDNAFLEFYNPSFGDFMSGYLQQNQEEVSRIMESVLFFDQYLNSFSFENDAKSHLFNFIELNVLFFGKKTKVDRVKIDRSFLLELIIDKIDNLKTLNYKQSKELAISGFLISQYKLEEIEAVLIELYPNIQLDVIPKDQFEDLFELASLSYDEETEIFSLLRNDIYTIILKLFELVSSEGDFIRVRDLFYHPALDYNEFLEDNKNRLQNIVDTFWSPDTVQEKIDYEDFSEYYKSDTILEKLNKMEEELKDINNVLEIDDSPNFKELYKWDYNAIIKENLENHSDKTNGDDEYQAPVLNTGMQEKSAKNSLNEIDEIFDGLLESRAN